jgi:hypothetical protein
MKNLVIESTNCTPKINLDATNGVIEFFGKSYPENTFDFYKPVKEWLDEYSQNSNEITIVNLELTYLNSSSLKVYFDIFDIFEEIHNRGKKIEVNWTYESDDDIIEETGEDFIEDFKNLKINLIAKEK